MNTLTKSISIKSIGSVVKIILLGDFHIGNAGCDEEAIKKHVDWIKHTDNCYWVDMGDKIEAITRLDKRWDSGSVARWIKAFDIDDLPMRQADRYIELMTPIRHKCLGIIEGNHEYKLKTLTSLDVHTRICAMLGVPNLGFMSFVKLLFRRIGKKQDDNYGGISVIMLLTHGAGGGSAIGNKINKLNKLASDFDADIYAAGHHHDKICYKKRKGYINRAGQYLEKTIVYCAVPSFFRTYVEGVSTYSERALYSPSATGVVKLEIKPFVQIVDKGMRHWRHGAPDIHISE